jgi:hypothetical protein
MTGASTISTSSLTPEE